MKRLFMLLLSLVLLAACNPAPDVPTYGRVAVGIEGCREPQLTYFLNNLRNLQTLGGPDWHVAVSPEVPDVVVACVAFADSEPGAARYQLGSGYVEVDPARANGEFAFSAAFEHELVHWRIYHGPRPVNVTKHVCHHSWERADCWDQEYGDALMNPSLGADMGWDGDTERLDTGDIAMNICAFQDTDMFRWAAHP